MISARLVRLSIQSAMSQRYCPKKLKRSTTLKDIISELGKALKLYTPVAPYAVLCLPLSEAPCLVPLMKRVTRCSYATQTRNICDI